MKDCQTPRIIARLWTTALLLALFATGHCAAAPRCAATTGPDFAGKDLSNTNFAARAPDSLVGANFRGATLKGAKFANQNLQGASFEQAIFGPGDGGSVVDFSGANLDQTCFAGATGLGGADLSYASFHCTDFSNTVLVDAVFGPVQAIRADQRCRTSFAGATLRIDAISLDNWGRVDFSGARFHGLDPASFSLAGQDVSGAILAGIDFSNVNMRGANLTEVDFSSARLTRADLRGATLNGARLNNVLGSYLRLDCARFYGTGAVSSACQNAPPASRAPNAAADLSSANLQQASLLHTILDSATLSGANLAGANAQNASFRNASLEADSKRNLSAAMLQGADLSGTAFQNAHVNAVQFNDTTLAGAHFDGSTLNDTNFSGAIMPGASFGGRAVLEGVNFHGAILENAVFTDATIRNSARGGAPVDFSCAQLGGASFQDANVSGANFQAAVMPPAAACCQKDGKAWCGTVDFPVQAYGGVRYPALQSALTCPNGDNALCNASQWTLPGWQTSLCNPSHNNQTVWVKPDCGNPPGNVVHFKDARLKDCILAMLPGHPAAIEVSTAQAFRTVSCPQQGISDLTGLEQFTGLVSLDLAGNQLVQFRLPSATQLEKLKLSDNALKTLDLTGLDQLLDLDASHNQLHTIVSWVALQNAEVLDLSYNQLTQPPLAALSALVMADISHNAYTDVLGPRRSNLKGLASLRYLDISSNNLTSIGDFATPDDGSPAKLQLQCNPRFDCSSLNIGNDQDALENSACARYNSQTEKWLLQPHPSCPSQPRRR